MKIKVLYLDGKIYGWSQDKFLINKFLDQRNRSKFVLKKIDFESISNLPSGYQLIKSYLGSKKDDNFEVVMTIDEQTKFIKSMDLISKFLIRVDSISKALLSDELKDLMSDIIHIGLDDDGNILTEQFSINDILLFLILFKNTF